MSLIATAKAKAANASVKEAFKNETGAIDLASIMVGIIVIGLIGGVIAATVFAVIPWAQDNAAKQQLDSVVAAQSAYIGLSADASTGANNTYGDQAQLSTAGLLDVSALGDDIAIDFTPYNVNGATAAEKNSHFAAAIESSSGKIFYVSDLKTQPTEAPATLPANTPAVVAGVVADVRGA